MQPSAVSGLKRKYHALLPELAAERTSYTKMIESVGAGLIVQWQKQMDQAHRKRANKVDVMDSFEVVLDKGELSLPPRWIW